MGGTYIEIDKKVKGWKKEVKLLKLLGFIECEDLSDKEKEVMWSEGEWDFDDLTYLLDRVEELTDEGLDEMTIQKLVFGGLI